jgi:hypothetical protein
MSFVALDRLPTFPSMEDLAPVHLRRIRELVAPFPSYSDFSVVSLWSWSAAGRFRVAEHTGNLIVEFGDYIRGERHLSFIGSGAVGETAHRLLQAAESDPSLLPTLQLVPEFVATELRSDDRFEVIETPDDRDYVYDSGTYVTLSGPIMRRIRQATNRHERVVERSGSLEMFQGDAHLLGRQVDPLVELYDRWEKMGREGVAFASGERIAFEHLLSTLPVISPHAEIRVTYGRDELDIHWVKIDDRRLDESMGHFAKSDDVYGREVDTVSFVDHMRSLNKVGVRRHNMQQDLGLAGLREHKEGLRPAGYLNKYSVTLKDSARH